MLYETLFSFIMEDFLHFLDECPTPYHFIAYARRELLQNGFVELDEKTHFNLDEPQNQKAFVVRDERSIIAFKLNNKQNTNSGESVVGICTNCDSPCFKLKYNYLQNKLYGEVKEEPEDENYTNAFFNDDKKKNQIQNTNNQNQKVSGYQLLRLSLYGNALWHTFFDRDLRLAGLVYVRDPKTNQISQRLVDSKRGVAVLPNCAIHQISSISLSPTYDPEKHFTALFNIVHDKDNKKDLRTYVASLLGDGEITEDQIVDWDLRFVDANNSDNFNNLVFGERLSNLSSCYAGLKAIISDKPLKLKTIDNTENQDKQETENQETTENAEAASASETQEGQTQGENAENQEEPSKKKKGKKHPFVEEKVELEVEEDSTNESNLPIQVLAIFDNEAIGSNCRSGGKSDFLQSILTEIYHYYFTQKSQENVSLSEVMNSLSIKNNSFLVSCASTHGTHPINDSPSDFQHPSVLGKGPVVKCTTRSSLATELFGTAIVKEASKKSGVPLQLQFLKNTSNFDVTIGTHIAFKTGIRTVDVGCPILSKESIRETMNFTDIVKFTALLSELLNNYNSYRISDDVQQPENVEQNE